MLITLLVLAAIYFLICLALYMKQESVIFYPVKLPPDYVFRFNVPFEERTIQAPDGIALHGLLFKADAARGADRKLVFFLHGNAGAVDGWGDLAPYYTSLGYDFFVLDYRGYGKSEGKIESEQQFYADVQAAYQQLTAEYRENNIVVVGFSIGTASASMLAARNNPRMLILLAPYYSLVDMLRHTFPFVPPFLLKYKFRNNVFIEQAKVPVYIFHGNRDEVIPYSSSVKLRKYLEPASRHITLEGQDHNGIHQNRQYRDALKTLLLPHTSEHR